ncbi:MAG: response regulator transcription factor [Candidatus Aminicenantaceae bacterium]
MNNNNMKILIVEDDKKLSAFLQKGLREEQFAVDVCRNGANALHFVEINDYDVIILDLMLPGKDGLTVCKELREQSITTPIIMLTAKDTVEDKISGLSEGADDYLTKPFSFAELLARIKALLRRNQDYKEKTLKIKDLELNPWKRTVFRGDKEISLTGKEYALLEYLMRHKGQIVSKSMIIEHVWDMNYEGLSNVVNVYINHLRKKIEIDSKEKLIRTIKGYGYKIDANKKD